MKIICTSDIPEDHRTITVEDVMASFGYLLNLMVGLGTGDDIDHLANRRVRRVGELLQNQFLHRPCPYGTRCKRTYDHSGC